MTVVQWTGREARLLRLAMRLGQREFAARLGLSDTAVASYERPQRRDTVRLRYETQQMLDTALARADRDVRDRFQATLAAGQEPSAVRKDGDDGQPGGVGDQGAIPMSDGDGVLARSVDAEVTPLADVPPAEHPILVSIRNELVARSWSGGFDSPAAIEDGDAVAARGRAGHDAYQRADYAAAAQLLTASVLAAEQLIQGSSGETQRKAHRVLAITNVGLSKLAAKLGDASLAWITADRAASAARLGDSHILAAVASYQIACALLAIPGRLSEAGHVVDAANEELNRTGQGADPAVLSVRGALLLLAAIISARQADRAAAGRRLTEAGLLAESLGHDGNHLYTAFGPTNVAIHRVGVFVQLQDPSGAISVADTLDTFRMPPALLSRRAQVHLDLAEAYAMQRNGDSSAVLHLLEAERIAPQVVGGSHHSRSLLARLVARHRRSATPGLRALAERAGVLV